MSETKVSGTIFDICPGSKQNEFLLGGSSGLTFIYVDPSYFDYDIEIIDILFKNRGITRLVKINDKSVLIVF